MIERLTGGLTFCPLVDKGSGDHLDKGCRQKFPTKFAPLPFPPRAVVLKPYQSRTAVPNQCLRGFCAFCEPYRRTGTDEKEAEEGRKNKAESPRKGTRKHPGRRPTNNTNY